MHVRYQAALRPDGLELLFITTLLSSTIPERFIYLIVYTKQYVTHGYLLRLSIIRLAFPSCLGIDEGSTSLILACRPMLVARRFSIISMKALCFFISSKKIFSFTSTWTSSVSSVPSLSTINW